MLSNQRMLIQIISIFLAGAAAYYLGARTLATSPLFASYPIALWSGLLLSVLVAFVTPVVFSHLPREYVIKLNPNNWLFAKLMMVFIFTVVLMMLSDLFFYLAGSQISPAVSSQMLNYRPLFIFGITFLLAILAL